MITDCRFENKASAIRDMGGFLIQVDCPDIVRLRSDAGVCLTEQDAVLENMASLVDLSAGGQAPRQLLRMVGKLRTTITLGWIMSPRRDPTVNFRAAIDHTLGVHAVLDEEPPLVALMVYGVGSLENYPAVSEVAKATKQTLKTTSRVLKVLRQRGYVKMVGDSHDTRKRRVRLTSKGENIMKLLNGALVDVAFRITENVRGR